MDTRQQFLFDVEETQRELARVHAASQEIPRLVADLRSVGLRAAVLLGQAGGEEALGKVERKSKGWGQRALDQILAYALTHERFTTEEAREGLSMPEGSDGRAWGPIMRMAVKRGIVRAVGFKPARSSNGALKIEWQSLVLVPEPDRVA